MEKCRKKAWRLLSAKPTDKAITRDGREVLKWRVVGDPKESLWVTEVTLRDSADGRKRLTYVVNHNGRRYANVQSDDDIFLMLPPKVSRYEGAPPDVMPDVMRAIEAAKNHDIASVRLANKHDPYECYGSGESSRYMIIDNSE